MRKKRPNFLFGETAVGSCWEALALARDHVLLLAFGWVPVVSRQNGQADEAVTLGHSATSWGVGNPRNRPFGRSLQW